MASASASNIRGAGSLHRTVTLDEQHGSAASSQHGDQIVAQDDEYDSDYGEDDFEDDIQGERNVIYLLTRAAGKSYNECKCV